MAQWHALHQNGCEYAASVEEIISIHRKNPRLSDIPTGHARLCTDVLGGLKSNAGMQNTCTQVHITAKDSRRPVAIRTPQNDKTSYSPGERRKMTVTDGQCLTINVMSERMRMGC